MKAPTTEAVASNCVAESEVPAEMLAGDDHAITGTAWVTFRLVVELELAVYEEEPAYEQTSE